MESASPLSSQGGAPPTPPLSQATTWPQSLVQDGHVTHVGRSDVRKPLPGPPEKEASCSSENAARRDVLSSIALTNDKLQEPLQPPEPRGQQPWDGADVVWRREVRWKAPGSLVILSHSVKPCGKPDQSWHLPWAELMRSLYLKGYFELGLLSLEVETF